MAFEKVREYFKSVGLEDRVRVFNVSSATVELASIALNCEPDRIAKSLTFGGKENPIMVVVSGESRIDNHKFKETFGVKATMIKFEDVLNLIGHEVGGVCPFCVKKNVKVYLDISLKKFDFVFPACGSDNSAVKLSIEELEKYSNCINWVDVCKEMG